MESVAFYEFGLTLMSLHLNICDCWTEGWEKWGTTIPQRDPLFQPMSEDPMQTRKLPQAQVFCHNTPASSLAGSLGRQRAKICFGKEGP